MLLFIASIWAIAMLWAIYRALIAILEELRGWKHSNELDD